MKKNNLLWSTVLTSATILATLPIQNVKAETAPQEDNQSTSQTINSPLNNKIDESSNNTIVANDDKESSSINSIANLTSRTLYSTTASINNYTSTAHNISQIEFLNSIKAASINGWQQYHILPSITAAQAILESGWGNSQLAQKYNNLFGIKGAYNGQSVILSTSEEVNGNNITIDSQFRVYDNWNESIADHGVFLSTNYRYHNLAGIQDYHQVAQLLHQDGYAAASDYAQSLIKIIENNNLQAWDQEVLGNNAVVSTPINPVVNKTESGTYIFQANTNIYTSASTKGKVVGRYLAGQKVVYDGKVQAEGTTWLRYTSYSGATCYVPISTPVVNSPQPTKVTPSVKPTNNNDSGTYTFKANTNIYTSASTKGKVVGQYLAGQKVVYDGKVQAEGTTWLRYTSYSGATCYVPISTPVVNSPQPTKVTPAAKPTSNHESGTYIFQANTNIYTSASTKGKVVGRYLAGQKVVYDGKVQAEGTTWLRYTSYSGATCYVPISTPVVNSPQPTKVTPAAKPTSNHESGTYIFQANTNIYTSASTKGKVVGRYLAGQKVVYDGKVQAEGTTWLRYTSYSGATCYVPISKSTKSQTVKNSISKVTTPTAAYGTYTFTTTTNIRTSPSLKGKIVGHYNAGQQVFYNGKVVGDGYTWLHYQTQSGTTCYVAVLN